MNEFKVGDTVCIIREHYSTYSKLKDRVRDFGMIVGGGEDTGIVIVDFSGKKMCCSTDHLRKIEIVFPTNVEQRTSASTAVHTLESLGYTWCGGELWKPPVGKVPAYVTDDVDTTITQRGERYGKFKDGAVIMQDLKNVMRETPNWEGLTPSQREALEMIQHKIGRILNGDPMYDDNWRDICGYSQLVLDELNGVVR